MDLKTFGGDDFDPKKWINKAWSTSGNQDKEVFVANTLTRLQLYMKQLTNSLDETTTQIVTSVPRILQDASSLQIEGALLQQKLVGLEQQVRDVEHQTGHSIESLQRVDQLKSRLENAASALREADKWAALASSLEDILETGVPTQGEKLAELADKVAAMTASLEVLSDAPDFETKKVQLETLYNRLEAAISPHLVDALTQMDAERTTTYIRVYTAMRRTSAAARCWRRSAATRALNWRRLPSHTVPALTALLTDDAQQQVEWLSNVVKSETPLAELIRLYTDILLSLDPPIIKVVSANFKLCQTSEDGVTMLIDLRTDIEQFVTRVRIILDAPRPHKESVPPATLREVGRAAYAPLRELLPNYTQLQAALLCAHLSTGNYNEEDLLEYSRTILSLVERSEGWLSAAQNNAKKIAGDAAYPYFAPAVEKYITQLLSHITSHTRRIEARFQESVTLGAAGGVLSSGFPAALALHAAAADLLALAAKYEAEPEKGTKPANPLLDIETLLESEARKRVGSSGCCAEVREAAVTLRGLAARVLRHPAQVQLDKIPTLSVWNNNDALSTDLPDFALSPQEYITEIGQYLMTLPQHLEMHVSEKHVPWQYLTEVCTYTCEVYAEKILNIRNMDALGTKRCLTDIVYLSSVVEDLGTSITPALKNLEKSLRAASSQE